MSDKKKLKVCLISAYSIVPPYGILSLAAVLEKNGIDVKILDFTKRNVEEDVILDGIEDSDIIGLSSWSFLMITEVARITRMIREKSKKRKFLMWGGVHPTLFPKEVMEEFDLDAVCVGEGEFALLELAKAFESGGDISKVKGLWVKKDGSCVFTGQRNEVIDVAALPKYAWHLIDVSKYIIKIKLTSLNELTLVESRGCPYRCTFCYAPRMFGSKWRGRTPDQIIEDVKFLKEKYKIQRFDFLDDLPFGGNRNQMLEFCKKIKELHVQWSCDQRINIVDEEILRAMKDSGIWYIYFGVESGSPRMLEKIKKVGVTPEKIIKVYDLCFKVGISTMAGFIIGLPGETEDDLNASLKLAKRIKATMIRVASYVPYAGTELYEEALKMGFKPPVYAEDWGKLGTYANVTLSLTEVPREKLMKAQRKMQEYSYMKSISFAFRHREFSSLPYFIFYTALHINPDSRIPYMIKKTIRPLIWLYSRIHSLR
jgi:anaerobic magnesium-protoporphyrin IX monomethyl ester cyclase